MSATQSFFSKSPRRSFIVVVGGGLLGHAALLRAQTPGRGVRRVGVLAPCNAAKEKITLKPFFDQMRQLGWIEGQTVVYDRAYADDSNNCCPGWRPNW